MIKRFIQARLAKSGVEIFKVGDRYTQDGLATVHSDHFRADPAFRAAYARGIKAGHGVDPAFEWRAHIALWAARTSLHVAGDFVECGVNAGFMSSAIMHALQWNSLGRRFYLIDTFAGSVLAQFSQEEVGKDRLMMARRLLNAGAYVTDLDRIYKNFAEWPGAIVIQGAVPEVLQNIEFGKIAFLHIDMNCALPERMAIEFFWDRLSPGAVILFDDYAYRGHECQRDALDAAARERGSEILSLPTGQGLTIR
jgi:hypothetical protein